MNELHPPIDKSVKIEKNDGVVNVHHHPPNNTTRVNSIITQLLISFSTVFGDSSKYNPPDYAVYEITEKLDYNSVVKYREGIEGYGEFGYSIESAYNALDKATPGSKEKIFSQIKSIYQDTIGQIYLEKKCKTEKEKLSAIKDNSDSIIEKVMANLKGIVEASANLQPLNKEDIELGIRYVSFHAFIECKILEKPK